MDSQNPTTFTLHSTYTPTINSNATILNLHLTSLELAKKSSNKYVLIVLDISGSMSGAKLDTSKDAICDLIKTIYETNPNPKVDLITFNSFPTFHSLQNKSYSQCVKEISQIYAGGGTNFIPVFKLIRNLLRQEQTNQAASALTNGKKVKLDSSAQQGIHSNQEPIEEVAVVFLSDGEGEDLSELKPEIEKMRNFAEEKLSSAEFHTLGFGADHDARLLEELTKSMPNQGTFQYIRESAEVAECVQNVSSCLMGRRLNAFVSWLDEENVQQKKVNFAVKKHLMEEEDQKEVNWEAVVCISKPLAQFEALKNTLVLNIKQEEGYKTLNIVTEYKEPEEKVTEMSQNFFYINEELKKISDAIIAGEKFDAKKAEEYRDHVAGYRVMLNELMRGLFKLKIDQRNAMMDRARDLNEYMDKIGELLRTSANKGLTNDQIASVNALAYRQVTRNSNLKTLDKRTLQNVDLLNQVAEKVKEVASKFDEKEFTDKYEALIDQVGCCALNLSNIPEALKSQDCLCLTFDMARPEVAIQDASRIIIKKIYPTVICATAFLDSVKFSMKLNPNKSGGFDPAFQGGDGIVKGASNESITGAMPLYFCGEHWQAASQYIKPILGWDVTLDPLGYDYNQVRTVPFLLLIAALNDKNKTPNEFNLRVHKWILDTCCQIIKDEVSQNPNSNLVKLVTPIWEKYDKFGTLRGVEAVQNSNVLLAYVYCLQEMGLMEKDPEEVFMKKIGYVVEEEMRRRQDKAKIWNTNQIKKSVKQILDIDVKEYANLIRGEEKLDKMIEESVKHGDKNESFDAKGERFQRIYEKFKVIQPKKNSLALKLERENKNREKAEKNKQKNKENSKEFKLNAPKNIVEKLKVLGFKLEDKFPKSFDEFGKVQKEHATQAFQNFKNATRFTKSWRKTWGYPEQEVRKIESIGITTPIQLFALYIQNKIHHKNTDRQESFINKEYVDPFDQKAAEEYLYTLAGQVVYERVLKEENEKPKEMNCAIKDIEFFARTMNLEAAAGVLVSGFNLGSMEALQHILRHSTDKCYRVWEKLMMIKCCEFKGVSFEFDFKMKKKFLRQLFKKFEGKYKYEEWKELWYREKPKERN